MGGFKNEEHKRKFLEAGAKNNIGRLWDDPVWVEKHKKRTSEQSITLHKLGILKPPPSFKGQKHTAETLEKLSKSKNNGESNPQFGTCWITNGTESKKIKKEDLHQHNGWYKGRVQKINSMRYTKINSTVFKIDGIMTPVVSFNVTSLESFLEKYSNNRIYIYTITQCEYGVQIRAIIK